MTPPCCAHDVNIIKRACSGDTDLPPSALTPGQHIADGLIVLRTLLPCQLSLYVHCCPPQPVHLPTSCPRLPCRAEALAYLRTHTALLMSRQAINTTRKICSICAERWSSRLHLMWTLRAMRRHRLTMTAARRRMRRRTRRTYHRRAHGSSTPTTSKSLPSPMTVPPSFHVIAN